MIKTDLNEAIVARLETVGTWIDREAIVQVGLETGHPKDVSVVYHSRRCRELYMQDAFIHTYERWSVVN